MTTKKEKNKTKENSLEYILTNSFKKGMVSYIDAHPHEFENLIKLAVSEEQSYSWRAAWLLSACMKQNDKRVAQYMPQLVEKLKEVKGGYQRELINVLRKMNLSEEYEGLVFDICLDVWSKIEYIPSVRFNAFRLVLKITQTNIELYQEVKLFTQDHYTRSLSNGIKNSFYKKVSDFEKKNKKVLKMDC